MCDILRTVYEYGCPLTSQSHFNSSIQ